jgi:hypothetical protein
MGVIDFLKIKFRRDKWALLISILFITYRIIFAVGFIKTRFFVYSFSNNYLVGFVLGVALRLVIELILFFYILKLIILGVKWGLEKYKKRKHKKSEK